MNTKDELDLESLGKLYQNGQVDLKELLEDDEVDLDDLKSLYDDDFLDDTDLVDIFKRSSVDVQKHWLHDFYLITEEEARKLAKMGYSISYNSDDQLNELINVYDLNDEDGSDLSKEIIEGGRKDALDNGDFYLTNGNDQLLIYAYAVTFGAELFENLYE